MSTTIEPSKEAALHLLAEGGCANGRLEPSLSQLAMQDEFWRKSAPKPLRKERLASDEMLAAYWNEREPRASVAELCAAAGTPLEWGKLAAHLSATTQSLLDLLAKRQAAGNADGESRKKNDKQAVREVQSALARWLEGSGGAPASYDLGLGCLAAAGLLSEFGDALSPSLGWKTLDFLWSTARHAPAWNLGVDAAVEDVVAAELLGGELPLALAYLFGEMAPMAKLARAASDFIEGSTVELLNGEGLLRGAHLSALRPLAGCWTRCSAMAAEVNGAKLAKKARRQYAGLVRQMLRWTAPDGTPLLAGDAAEALPPDFVRAALQLGGGKKDAAAAVELLGKRYLGDGEAAKQTPEAGYDCEWAGLAVLRRRWDADEPVLAVDYSTPAMRLEVWAGRRRLLGGAVTTESHAGGKLLRPTGPWENLCWFADKDVNYLELSLPLKGEARLDRQILLALRDGFMMIADHLHSPETAALEHVLHAPLGAGLLFCGEGETRDAVVVDGEPLARLIPLALPEWRIDPRVGELSFAGGAVRLAEQATAQALACPLFVDLRAKRSGQQSTWRQLTVAENLQIKSPDVAVSYRIQSGKDQWVLYRSQGPRGNRSFIGQNTSSEFVLARFKAPSGEVESLLEIEG